MALGKLSIKFTHLTLTILPIIVLVFGEFLLELVGNHFLFLQKAKLLENATTVNISLKLKSNNDDIKGFEQDIVGDISQTAVKRFFKVQPSQLKSQSWLTETERQLVTEFETATRPAVNTSSDIADNGEADNSASGSTITDRSPPKVLAKQQMRLAILETLRKVLN